MRPINRILCPVGLSDVSQQANDHALVMARWLNAAITALHVTNPIVIPSTDFAVVGIATSDHSDLIWNPHQSARSSGKSRGGAE